MCRKSTPFFRFKRRQCMNAVNPTLQSAHDLWRQLAILLAAPLIWLASSLWLFLDFARNQSEFSDLSLNLLVPQTFAFAIWFPIFLGIIAYGCLQALRVNRSRDVFRQSGWWIAAGLWGIIAWGLTTAFAPDSSVEMLASMIFLPTMVALVIGMTKIHQTRHNLDALERALILWPISLIAGWCSLAFFVGLNGVVWSYVEPLGWDSVWTALGILGLSLGWIITIVKKWGPNPAYIFPVIWGLSFLTLRHLSDGGTNLIASLSIGGILVLTLMSAPQQSKFLSTTTQISRP